MIFSKPLALAVSLFLTVTAAAAFIGFKAADPDGGQGNVTPTSVDPPTASGFDTPITTPLTGVKPLVVVLMEFSDLPHTPSVTPAFIRNQIFGSRPSMNDYYLETSYGQYSFSDKGHWAWITAWNDPATLQDESTRAYWNSEVANDTVYYGGIFQHHGLRSLDVAGYDFAPLDLNTDGKVVFGPEAAYLLIDSQVANARGGATRNMPGGYTFDGKAIEGAAAGVSEDSPWITLYAHELAHESSWGSWFLTDYYGITPQNIGDYSLMGYSGITNSTGGWWWQVGPHQLDPLSKLKEGWVTPTVVAADGFYDVLNSELNPKIFVLYEAAHGKQEYFLVENKWKGSSYDNTDALIGALAPPLPPSGEAVDIPDEGILVWHVDETRDWDGTTTGNIPKVALERRGGDDSTAAWDGSDSGNYDFWDSSTPLNTKWNDGTKSKTGIWCASAAGATMRAYLDVPGPGVLICTGTLSTSAIPGTAGSITVPVRNTGDVADTFQVTISSPPDVVATVPAPVTVAAKTQTTVTVLLTPVRACTTAPGPRTVTITVSSTINPGVSGSTPATINVLQYGEPHITLATIAGEVEPGNAAIYSVSITNDGNAVDTFSLTFNGLDFGTAYRADPTSIPTSWVSFSPVGLSAPACGVVSTTMTITVPWDWAGMEDATYDFTVTVVGSISPDTDTASGQLIVDATPTSMMFYVRLEIKWLMDDVSGIPPAGARDGLYAKASAAYKKIGQAIDWYLAGRDPPSSNLFETTQNMLHAFLNQIDAQRGKGLTVAQADDLAAKANQIIDDIDAILLLI